MDLTPELAYNSSFAEICLIFVQDSKSEARVNRRVTCELELTNPCSCILYVSHRSRFASGLRSAVTKTCFAVGCLNFFVLVALYVARHPTGIKRILFSFRHGSTRYPPLAQELQHQVGRSQDRKDPRFVTETDDGTVSFATWDGTTIVLHVGEKELLENQV